MRTDELVEWLRNNRDVAESYVLVRELRLLLDSGKPYFHPTIRVKIYKSSASKDYPYSFTVSHNIHTPIQGAPYYPSRTSDDSELGAIQLAIASSTGYLKQAIAAGHEPKEAWLVENDDF